jgi:hypothetical protein
MTFIGKHWKFDLNSTDTSLMINLKVHPFDCIAAGGTHSAKNECSHAAKNSIDCSYESRVVSERNLPT